MWYTTADPINVGLWRGITDMNVCITGANRGLGLALTRVFLEQGHRVFATYRQKSNTLLDLEQQSNQLIPIPCDVTDEAQIHSLQQMLSNQAGALDILVHNAALLLERDSPDIEDLDFSVYLPTLHTNAVAPLMVTKHLLPLLRHGTGKTIIAISSEAGSIGSCWRDREYSYCMSKAALNMGMRILHNRLAPEGFRLRLIHPGWVKTDMGGSDAELTPMTAAQNVYERIMETCSAPSMSPEELYIDWEGKQLVW